MHPWDTYQSNLSIDLGKHHVPKTFLDKVAYRTVKVLRIPTDIFFQTSVLTNDKHPLCKVKLK
ncbi:ubiquinol oxidase (non-electrogenic) [Sarracenia purpurea var. burkii]